MFKVKFLTVILSLSSINTAHGTEPVDPNALAECGKILGTADEQARAKKVAEQLKVDRQALIDLRDTLPIAFPDQNIKARPWYGVLSRMLISAKTDPSDLVTVALIGAARMGKSTISNALPSLARGTTTFDPNENRSVAGRRGGTTRSSLIMIPRGSGDAFDGRMKELESRHPGMQLLDSAEQLLEPDKTFYTFIDGLEEFPNVVFIDTPDMTTGDHRDGTEGKNIANARHAMLAADVLAIVLDDSNVRDRRLGEILAENFKLYGLRRSVFILRTDAESDEEYEESKDLLIEASRRYYELAKDSNDPPEAVLSMFAMPISRAVRLGQARPQLHALSDYSPFPILMSRLATESPEIRGYAGREAAIVIFNDIKAEVRTAFGQRYAAKIIGMALDAAGRVPPEPIKFPYRDAPQDWRKIFESARPELATRILEKMARMSAVIGQSTFEAAKNFSKRFTKPHAEVATLSLDAVIMKIHQDLRAAWGVRLTKLTKALQNNRVEVSRADAEELLVHIKRFNALYPKQKVDLPQLAEYPNLTTVMLPDLNLLGANSRAALEKLRNEKDEDLLNRLNPPVKEETTITLVQNEIAKGLAEAQRLTETSNSSTTEPLTDATKSSGADARGKYSSTSKERDLVLNGAAGLGGSGGIVGGGAAIVVKAIGLAAFGSLSGGLAGIAAGVVVSGVARSILEGKMDADLEILLEKWFKEYQERAFAKALGSRILEPLHEVLDNDITPQQDEAIAKVLNALRTLGAPVPDYSHE